MTDKECFDTLKKAVLRGGMHLDPLTLSLFPRHILLAAIAETIPPQHQERYQKLLIGALRYAQQHIHCNSIGNA